MAEICKLEFVSFNNEKLASGRKEVQTGDPCGCLATVCDSCTGHIKSLSLIETFGLERFSINFFKLEIFKKYILSLTLMFKSQLPG